ncbi:MAG TPA: hypothetical protein VJW51_09025 [Candidatus Acidoferrales bacterium]|nr:hypothetical protein [Candidatus Acidoferrales bacterium]
MSEIVRQVEHYSASVANGVGEGAKVLGALHAAGINLIALWGYARDTGKATLEFIPENGAAFAAAAKGAKLKLSKKQIAFHVKGEDRPGAIADLLAKLAAAKINVGAVQAVCAGSGRYGAVIFLPQAAVGKAAKALGAA